MREESKKTKRDGRGLGEGREKKERSRETERGGMKAELNSAVRSV